MRIVYVNTCTKCAKTLSKPDDYSTSWDFSLFSDNPKGFEFCVCSECELSFWECEKCKSLGEITHCSGAICSENSGLRFVSRDENGRVVEIPTFDSDDEYPECTFYIGDLHIKCLTPEMLGTGLPISQPELDRLFKSHEICGITGADGGQFLRITCPSCGSFGEATDK